MAKLSVYAYRLLRYGWWRSRRRALQQMELSRPTNITLRRSDSGANQIILFVLKPISASGPSNSQLWTNDGRQAILNRLLTPIHWQAYLLRCFVIIKIIITGLQIRAERGVALKRYRPHLFAIVFLFCVSLMMWINTIFCVFAQEGE